MLKTLSEANLATYTPYEGARLTDSGQRLAMKVIRRHRLLERFLAETLTMSWDEVHEEAEHMEHAASERLIDRIDAYLGYPAVDPHGDPIPRADGSLAETEGVPLARCQPGQHFRVVRVMDQDPAFLRYLERVRPGTARNGRTARKSARSGRSRLQARRTKRRTWTGRGRQGAWWSSQSEGSPASGGINRCVPGELEMRPDRYRNGSYAPGSRLAFDPGRV